MGIKLNVSRHHHYLSQCYLKGFTQGGSKNSKITVIDFKNKKKFETIPRNVGGMRDFNRVEIEGVDPEIVEKQQADFEGKVASALKRLEETLDFTGETRDLILELIGMLAIKSPQMREHLAKPLLALANQVIAQNFESKERWDEQIAILKEDTEVNTESIVPFEKMKSLFEQGAFKVAVNQEHQIHMELIGMQYIKDALQHRNWILIKPAKGAGEFITNDNPVSLTWIDNPPAPYISPGFGLKNTMVYFPVSKNLALIGEFDIVDEVRTANPILVAILNNKIIANSYQRVIASKINFNYIAKGGLIKQGNSLV